MEEKVQNFIKKNNLIKPNSTAVLALSGGPDSVALVDILFKLRKKYGLKLVIAHLNHGLRGRQSKLDERFIKKLAGSYGLLLEIKEVELTDSSEKTARNKRYEFLKKVADKHSSCQVLLGHNRTDQLETIIYNFIRGAGLKGLSGMRPKSKRDGINLIRPLLDISRSELIEYLDDSNLNYRLDPSNVRLDYTRNKLRHQVIPELEKLNPNLEALLTDKSDIYYAVDKYMVSQSLDYLSKNTVEDEKAVLDQKSFLALHSGLKYYVLRTLVKKLKGSLTDITSLNIQQVLDIFNESSDEKKTTSFQGLKFVKKSGKLTVAVID